MAGAERKSPARGGARNEEETKGELTLRRAAALIRNCFTANVEHCDIHRGATMQRRFAGATPLA